MTSYSRQDVLRILQISARQLQGWERANLIPQQQTYSFQDLGQLLDLAQGCARTSIRSLDPGLDCGDEGRGGDGKSAA